MVERFFGGDRSGGGLFGSRLSTEGDFTSTDGTTDGSGDTDGTTDSSGDGGFSIASLSSGDGYYGVYGITAGTTGTGNVTIDSGAYYVGRLYSGVPDSGYAPTYGYVMITGAETSVTVQPAYYGNGQVLVGVNNPGGKGYLSILAGATVTAYGPGYGGYNQINIGRGTDSFGQVTVDGAGSALRAAGEAPAIQVGRDGGEGELIISGGGYVNALWTQVGRGTGSKGTLSIDGAGSEFVASAAGGYFSDPAYVGVAAQVDIGRDNGKGYLVVTNGGELRAENIDGATDSPFVRFGREIGAYGYGTISGTGSALNIVQTGPVGDDYGPFSSLIVGSGGRGMLEVSYDAQINVLGDQAQIVVAQGRDGAANTTSAQSQLLVNNGADVLIDSQAYTGAKLRVGAGPGTNGFVHVDGAGSTLTVTDSTDFPGDYGTGQIEVGLLGYGRLDVTNGAAVESEGLGLGGYCNGYAGYGIVNITGGGTVTVTGTDATAYKGVRIGQGPGSTGIVAVDGAGSTLTSEGGAGRIRVVQDGTGALNIGNGGQVFAFFIDTGRNDGANGRITVDGAGSMLKLSDAYGHFPVTAGYIWARLGFCASAATPEATAISASAMAAWSRSSTIPPRATMHPRCSSAATTARRGSG